MCEWSKHEVMEMIFVENLPQYAIVSLTRFIHGFRKCSNLAMKSDLICVCSLTLILFFNRYYLWLTD